MDTKFLKKYAPEARREFITAVTNKAAVYGLLPGGTILPMREEGDVVIIGDRPFPRSVAKQRKELEARIRKEGFQQFIEAVAYTWFNRFVAIRYMELHGYLDHGYRVLSSRQNAEGSWQNAAVAESSIAYRLPPTAYCPPEILENAERVELPGLNRDEVVDLKLDGGKDEQLYQMLLLAQCNALHKAMPFLFESIKDGTELLLPDNLLHTDSLVRTLVSDIPEEQWENVEIIGWLYQFYISEKKDEVIGKVVKSEDIPAATQLFTPNWIVKYLVQNTLGRLWLEHHPDSPLKANMEFYIEPAEQTPEVQQQLQEIILKRATDQHGWNTDEEPGSSSDPCSIPVSSVADISLNPEKLTLLDPACGSGHILLEAYELFKAIYEERGYRARDIPALILTKNLYGLEIDDRAAQLAAFALMMKARADDRQLFAKQVSGTALAAGVSEGNRHTTPVASAIPLTVSAIDRQRSGVSVQPHVMALVETQDMDAEEIAAAVSGQWGAGRREEPAPPPGHLFETEDNLFTRAATSTTVEGSRSQSRQRLGSATPTQSLATLATPILDDEQLTTDIRQLIELFAEARTFGSLIQVPQELAARLPLLEQRVNEAAAKGELSSLVATKFQPIVEQARLLARQYDCVVANPPYMGGKYFASALKEFVGKHYMAAKADSYACFIQRNADFAKQNAFFGMITIPNWMFLSSFEDLRKTLFDHQTIDTFIHNGRGVFGSDFGTCNFVYRNASLPLFRGTFRRLFEKQGSVASNEELEQRFATANNYTLSNADFAKIPGSPVAYWISERMRQCFQDGPPLGEIAEPRMGMATGDNALFLRLWYEVNNARIGFRMASREQAQAARMKWFPYRKGGEFRRWYGNDEWLVDWENDGHVLQKRTHPSGRIWAHNFNLEHIFRTALTWTATSSSYFGIRHSDAGFLFDAKGSSCFPTERDHYVLLGLLSSKQVTAFLACLNPTVEFQPGNIATIPVIAKVLSPDFRAATDGVVREAVALARTDWNSFETSWDFQTLPVLRDQSADAPRTLAQSQAAADAECLARFQRMKQLEEENNHLFIDAYGLQDELSPEVPDDQITLYRPDREQDIKRLISYALGCMMGRYSLDKPGLIYAHSGNERFDEIYNAATDSHGSNTDQIEEPHQHSTSVEIRVSSVAKKTVSFPPDEDGIIPMTDMPWFPDDAAHRFERFIKTAWPAEHLEENLKFVAESLGQKKGETSRECIRRYLATGFYKHHLSLYKKRPIYWLFSSGKQRAFQCLVYLHRYNAGTLSRMRTEYVVKLQGKINARIEQLESDIPAAASTSHRKKLEKERDTLIKQREELQTFDEKLRHYADHRIELDLDDGVKVNYGKFGDLLAEVKSITGGKE